MQKGGSVEVDVVDSKRFPAGCRGGGRLDGHRAVYCCCCVRQRAYSLLTPKRVVAKFSVNDPTPKPPTPVSSPPPETAYTRRRDLAAQQREMAALSQKLDEAKVEGERLKELAAAPTPKATNLDNWSDDWAAALGSGKKGFEDAPPAPSTRELLAFLDTYDDGQRPAFPDEVLPASEFPPPPQPSRRYRWTIGPGRVHVIGGGGVWSAPMSGLADDAPEVQEPRPLHITLDDVQLDVAAVGADGVDELLL